MAVPAAIEDLLLQSHERMDGNKGHVIRLLPALPSARPRGTVRGLRARGEFEVNIEWNNGELTRGTFRSNLGRLCTLRYQNTVVEQVTERGRWYLIDGTRLNISS